MSNLSTCLACGAPIAQLAKGRRRCYCSEACRRAADVARKAERPATPKSSQCAICGGPIVQATTGRPRITCATCPAPQKPAQNAQDGIKQRSILAGRLTSEPPNRIRR